MVCLGNICRSPLAEGILKSKLDARHFFVDSAGTGSYHIGELPDPRSIAVARKNGIDITDQKARKFIPKDFRKFDLIYAMDKDNYRNICALAKHNFELQKVKMILNESELPQDLSVPDPYFGGTGEFETVYRMLNDACETLAKKLAF